MYHHGSLCLQKTSKDHFTTELFLDFIEDNNTIQSLSTLFHVTFFSSLYIQYLYACKRELCMKKGGTETWTGCGMPPKEGHYCPPMIAAKLSQFWVVFRLKLAHGSWLSSSGLGPVLRTEILPQLGPTTPLINCINK